MAAVAPGETAQHSQQFCDATALWVPAAMRIARHLVRTAEDAQDVVQESLLRLWSRWPVDTPEHGRHLFLTIVRGVAVDTLRSAYARRCTPCAEFDPSALGLCESAADTALGRVVGDRVLDGVPQPVRKVLYVHFWYGVPLSELSALCGIAHATLRSQKHRVMPLVQRNALTAGLVRHPLDKDFERMFE